MKTILILATLFVYYHSFGQMPSSESVDSVTNIIDRDTSLKSSTVVLDTLYLDNGTPVKVEVSFIALIDPKTNHLQKIIWNFEGEFYSFVTIYYNRGSAIKGLIKVKHRRTDTNPEFESNSAFYYSGDKVVKEIELNGKNNDYHTNGFWYLSTVNDFIKLAGLQLQ